jgi:hypothetical protein
MVGIPPGMTPKRPARARALRRLSERALRVEGVRVVAFCQLGDAAALAAAGAGPRAVVKAARQAEAATGADARVGPRFPGETGASERRGTPQVVRLRGRPGRRARRRERRADAVRPERPRPGRASRGAPWRRRKEAEEKKKKTTT